MENNIEKEKWIDEVMSSATGMARAKPPAGLYEKIMSGIDNQQNVKAISYPVKRWAAAAMILFILNCGSIIYYTAFRKSAMQINAVNPLAAEMPSVSTYNY